MSKLYRKITTFIVNWWAWGLDYVYVSYWQIYGFLVRSDARRYSTLNDPSLPAKTPIVLIPGVYENWQFMKPIATLLHNDNRIIHIIPSLGYNLGDVETTALLIEQYVDELKLSEYIIVAHSKGGLIGKFILASDKNTSKGMVALHTPFAGSKYASLIPLKTIRLFSPSSPTLLQLAMNTAINEKIISIYGIFDPHIPGGSYLDGAKNIQLHTRGHFKIMNDRRVHQATMNSVKQLENVK